MKFKRAKAVKRQQVSIIDQLRACAQHQNSPAAIQQRQRQNQIKRKVKEHEKLFDHWTSEIFKRSRKDFQRLCQFTQLPPQQVRLQIKKRFQTQYDFFRKTDPSFGYSVDNKEQLLRQKLAWCEMVATPTPRVPREDKQCGICSNTFESGEHIAELACRHVFHPEEIETWFKINKNCPLCRKQGQVIEMKEIE